MSLKLPLDASSVRVPLEVHLGLEGRLLGRLVYEKRGAREYSQFAYSEAWLADEDYFDVSPDLIPQVGYQLFKPSKPDQSTFFLALADTEPDAWGRRVIARAHAKARSKNPELMALHELDYLCAVDDYSRVGALRIQDSSLQYLKTSELDARNTPVLMDLEKILNASRAFELSTESLQDLQYLQGKATSLGGMRPKCTLLDVDGALALGKFPSASDERSVTQGEVLALQLAQEAGIESASARIEWVAGQAVAVIRRFDRTKKGSRIPYISGATLLQAQRGDEHAYTEIVDLMKGKCHAYIQQAQQLWRRLVFNHLIANVDDHLQNIGFLYVGKGLWKLAPAFDLNPFPDKERESKTWLSEDTGPITSTAQLLSQAHRFELTPNEALEVVRQVLQAVSTWRVKATTQSIGLKTKELQAFEWAFEARAHQEARELVA